jgi:hypothetical protein
MGNILKLTGIAGMLPLIGVVVFFLRIFYKLWQTGPSGIKSFDIIALGISFLTWGLWFIIYFLLMKTFGISTTGKVIGFKNISYTSTFKTGLQAAPQQAAIIEFATPDGKKFNFTSPYAAGKYTLAGRHYKESHGFNIGDPMNIIYDPRDPGRALENRLAATWWNIVCLLIGGILVWVGLHFKFGS